MRSWDSTRSNAGTSGGRLTWMKLTLCGQADACLQKCIARGKIVGFILPHVIPFLPACQHAHWRLHHCPAEKPSGMGLCPLGIIFLICSQIHQWLNLNSDNIVVSWQLA